MIYIVTCAAVAIQRPRDKANKQLPFQGYGLVHSFPVQRIRTQQ
jgi:hypothetical protein